MKKWRWGWGVGGGGGKLKVGKKLEVSGKMEVGWKWGLEVGGAVGNKKLKVGVRSWRWVKG